jgi:hypothetical protein
MGAIPVEAIAIGELWLGVREFHGLKSASAETRHH